MDSWMKKDQLHTKLEKKQPYYLKNPVFGFNRCSIGGNIGGGCIAGEGQNAEFTYNLNNQTVDNYQSETGKFKTTCY